jgi:hypothetical protein
MNKEFMRVVICSGRQKPSWPTAFGLPNSSCMPAIGRTIGAKLSAVAPTGDLPHS